MPRIVKSGLIQMSLPKTEGEGTIEEIKEAMVQKHLPYIEEAGKKGVQILCLQEIFNTPYFCPGQDRAWYAVGQAKQKLKELGWSDEQIDSLDGDWSGFTPAERSLFTLAKKLAATPVVLNDADVAEAVKQAGPRDVVQTIIYTTNRASFDRITESAGLRLEQ